MLVTQGPISGARLIPILDVLAWECTRHPGQRDESQLEDARRSEPPARARSDPTGPLRLTIARWRFPGLLVVPASDKRSGNRKVMMQRKAQPSPRRVGPLIVGLVLITGLIGVGVAEAAYTSEQHDGTPKYYNSRVAYTDNGSTIDIDQREFKGGRDGGAIKWRQESIKDYVNDVEQESVGYGSWAYNIALSSWYYYPSESHPTYTQTVEIRYVFKYQEWTEEEGYYYWFAGDLGNIEHTITP
jgi:hypothetical protein